MRSRSTIGTSSRRRASSASWRAIRPAPTIPIFRTRPRLRVRNADSALRAPLDEIERVDGRLGLRAGEELGESVLLGAIALLERPLSGAFDEVERAIGRGRRAVQLAVEPGARLSRHLADVREIGFGPHLAATFLDLLEQERERLVEELDRLEHGVGEALLERLRAREHAVLAERDSRR